MTADEVRAIAGGQLGEEPAEVSGVCHQFIDTRYNSDPGDGMIILLTRDVGYRVVGIRPPIYAKTSRGIGFGHDKDEIRRAYPNETITESSSQVGTEILVKDNGSDNYIGFTVGSDLHTVVGIHIGTHDFAANYELCSDG